MKTLSQHIKESIEKDELNFKIDTWLSSRPDEQELWDNACKSWKETRQVDNDAIHNFMNGTDVRAFIDFMNDNVTSNDIHPDDFETIKKIITNL